MKDRNIPLLKVFLAFLMATFVFLSGFLIGYGVSYMGYQEVSQNQQALRFDLTSLDIQSRFLEKSCDKEVLSEISKSLDQMGATMATLEQRLGKNDPKVLEQKKRYSLLEAQHFLNIKEYNKKCGESLDTILFFYSNKEDYQDMANTMGFVLDNYKKQNSKVMIYSFDYNLDSSIVRILKQTYNVTEPNTIVVNEGEKLRNVDDIDKVERVLN